MKPKQLTDDDINKFIYDLSDELETIFGIDFDNDLHYDALTSAVFPLLEKYSNGYVNYN